MDPFTVQQQNNRGPSTAEELRVAPPLADIDQPPVQIPGQARLDDAVGKAVGGTVIPSDMRPTDMPSSTKLDAAKADLPAEEQPQHRANPQSTQVDQSSNSTEKKNSEAKDEDKKDDKKDDKKEVPKDKVVGAYPVVTRIGWLEAYKRTDGPSNEFRDKSIWMEEFASSALFGAFWQNAAAVITLPVVCYVVFKLGGGFVSLILIIAFGATYYKNSIRRFRRNARDDITRELIRNSLENDAESTEWINNFMSKFWLIYEPVLSATVVQTVDGILVDQTPAFLDSIRLTTFTLGTKAPRVESIKTFPKTDPDVVMMDWRVSFTPTDVEDMTPRQLRTQINPKICLTIRVGGKMIGAGMPILVEDVSFQGYIRLKLKLTSNFPHIKTLDFTFLEPPIIDYVLKPVGGETFGMDIAHIPGLHSFIRDQTNAILGPMIVNPVWNETNIILINNLNEVVCMEIFDKDNVRKDPSLGQANFDLKSLEEDPVQDDVWCKVLRNGKERGSVRIRAAFFPVQKPEPITEGGEAVPVESNSGILSMNLAQAKDIARSGKTKSLCQISLNGRIVHETKKMLGASPAWGADVDVFVTDLQAAQIKVDVVSDGSVFGSYGVSASKLLQDTENKVEWATLNGGDSTGKIKMTAIWKPILMGEGLNPTVHKPAFGVLRVQFFAGRDIRNVEIGSSSDPYVVITGERGLGHGRTKAIENNLNPVWNEIHYVAVNSVKQVFDFEVYDYQKVTKDRTLGKTSFNVSEVIEELPDKAGYVARPKVDRWAPLKQKGGSNKGEIHYEISFYPSLDLAQEATENERAASPLASVTAPNSNGVAPEQVAPYNVASASSAPMDMTTNNAPTTLHPGTISAREELEYDSGILVTTLIGADLDRSGAYCEFYIDSDYYQYKSQVQKTRAPKWNEVADIFVKELEYAKLTVVVKEKSSMEKDPIIGVFTSHVRSLLEDYPKDMASLPLLDRGSQRGSIQLKFKYLPVPIELLPKERLDNMGNLTINLIRARNLIAADRSGASDPYLIFKVNGKDVYKSEVIKKTLNPEYNENFVLPIVSRADDQLSFEVFDWNQVSTAKSLGVGTIDLRSIQLVLPNDFLVPLQNKHNQGEVLLRVKFMPEFLSSNKRKSGFGATFLGGGVNAIGHAGMAGVGAVAGGVGAVGQGAMGVTGAVGKGAIKGVGAVGKGVFGGLSAGASAVGLHRRADKSGSQHGIDPSSSAGMGAPAVSADQSHAVGAPGNLTIHVVEADGLLGVDRSGSSDPYVKVAVNGQSVLKTKVKKETLAPNWNESVVVKVQGGHPITMNCLVKDHNTLGGNKDLGDCDIPVWEYIQPGAEGPSGQNRADFWAALGGTGGRLHLALEFEPSSGQ
ncbi:hypothetical protein BGZ54_007262 [Gamsiella multidivaricata]|nr:hypothetical protein BGZ54_007262 [Gamsiella multidivaricata]